MADEEPRRDEEAAEAPSPAEGGEPSGEQAPETPDDAEAGAEEEPAGLEGEDQPAAVDGEETVVEDEPARERSDEVSDGAEDAPARGRGERPSAEGKKAKADVVPGAELEPIKIEPERELSAEERARLEAEAEERARLEAEATAEEGEEPAVRREAKVEIPAEATVQATGKRKTSIARVIVRAGEGRFEVNDRALDEYFPRAYLRSLARQPLVAAGYEEGLDVRVRVHGGGIAGQAGAVRHGIARALCDIDPELRGELKRRGLLTRDARAKERRKAGLKKARKRPQFSKR